MFRRSSSLGYWCQRCFRMSLQVPFCLPVRKCNQLPCYPCHHTLLPKCEHLHLKNVIQILHYYCAIYLKCDAVPVPRTKVLEINIMLQTLYLFPKQFEQLLNFDFAGTYITVSVNFLQRLSFFLFVAFRDDIILCYLSAHSQCKQIVVTATFRFTKCASNNRSTPYLSINPCAFTWFY